MRPLTFSSQPHSPRPPLLAWRGGDRYTFTPFHGMRGAKSCDWSLIPYGGALAHDAAASNNSTASPNPHARERLMSPPSAQTAGNVAALVRKGDLAERQGGHA